MLFALAMVLAAASLSLALGLAVRLRQLFERLEAMERLLDSAAVRALPAQSASRPLAGLRVQLAIEQDHPHPVFATLLKEHLLREDVVEVVDSGGTAELVVSGRLVGNGYADVYYDAELVCHRSGERLFTLIERPPHGDRPANLAIELVTKLKMEMVKASLHTERRDALRELLD